MMAFYSRRDKDDDYNAWVTKGNSLSQLERHEEAIECYDKAIRLDSEDYDVQCRVTPQHSHAMRKFFAHAA